MKNLFFLLCLFLTFSCARTSDYDTRLEALKALGNVAPHQALTAYDSLCASADAPSNGHSRMKRELLGVRLRDKNDIIPQNDSIIRILLEYYEKNGSNREKQEVYYYAGSIYRDLRDTPRAIGFFLKSAERADLGDVDSLLLRNSFSQLYYQYFNVQDYTQALWAAQEECRVAEDIGVLDDISLVHVANTYLRLDMDSQARNVMEGIMKHQHDEDAAKRNKDVIFDLLYSYSSLHDTRSATACRDMLVEMKADTAVNYIQRLTLAMFYRAIGDTSSAIRYYRNLLGEEDPEARYNAAKRLCQLYEEGGDKDSANTYARLFLEASIQLDLGQRQRLAATVNNQFQYYRNRIEEEHLVNERQRYKLRMYLAIGVLLMTLTSGLLIHYYNKFRRITRLRILTDSLSDAKKAAEDKRRELNEKEELIRTLNEIIKANKTELGNAKEEMKKAFNEARKMRASLNQINMENKARKEHVHEAEKVLSEMNTLLVKKNDELTLVSLQLEKAEEELKKKNAILTEKTEQNSYLYRIQHQANLKRDAAKMLAAMKSALDSKDEEVELDWDEFISVMDTSYPEFMEQVLNRLGQLKSLQLRTCYLLKAGFTHTQIQNHLVKKVSRATAWRWIKIYTTALSDIINN